VLIPVLGKDVCSLIEEFELINCKVAHKKKFNITLDQLVELTRERIRNTIDFSPKAILLWYPNTRMTLDDYGYCHENGWWCIKRRFAQKHEKDIQARRAKMAIGF
jgi:hypothetical protein